jgi:3-hydroxyisobutyrate dehydrogenase-like beta-hydroxyacid dehydrogenase
MAPDVTPGSAVTAGDAVTPGGTPARVAVVGTGRMGGAMVGRLRAAGHPVAVWNRTRTRAGDLAATTGATTAATAREAVADAGAVLVSLADDAAVEAAYSGPDGLVAGLAPGTVVLETSTVSPDTVRALAPQVAARDAVLLDAPVSGSVPVVQRGELTFMVGGDPAALDRVRPVLDALASKVFQLGEVGAGATMKLAVNAVVHALNQALAESLVLAERAGIGREAAYEVFAASAVAAPFVHYKRAAFEHPDRAPAAFMLDLVAKDLDLIAALAERVGARMEQSAADLRVVREAVEAGYGTRDMSAIADFLRER